jgi:hypothetical protein
MPQILTADHGAMRRRAGLAVAGLLAAITISPLALASISAPARDATASALVHALQQAGLVCAVAGWTAVPENPRCVSVSRSRGPWFRLIDAGQY